MQPTDFPVNLANKDDIRRKLPEARQIYRSKQDALKALLQDVEDWGDLVALLARIAGEPHAPTAARLPANPFAAATQSLAKAPSKKKSPAQDRAIAGLKRAGRPMGPAHLYRFMIGENMPVPANSNALGAALWNAASSGRIKKTPDGLYALLEWETDEAASQDASRHGSSGESNDGPIENETTEPRSPATGSQEGT